MGNVYTVPPDVGDIWSYVTRELTSPKNITTDDDKIDNSKISNLDVLSSSRQKQIVSFSSRISINGYSYWDFPYDCFFVLYYNSGGSSLAARFFYSDTEYVSGSLSTNTLYIAKSGRVRLYNDSGSVISIYITMFYIS